jgi:FG-GAP-like repeat
MTLVRCLFLCALAGSFAPAQGLLFAELDGALPPQAASADALGDLDNDGDQDLVGTGVVILNDGHGRFTPIATPSLQFYRTRAVLADLNADGLLDLLSIDNLGLVRIDLGAPGLTFAGPVGGLPTFAPAGAIAKNLAPGDVDNDGDVDILIGLQLFNGVHSFYPVAPTLWLNNGVAGFATAPAAALPALNLDSVSLVLRDLDADGDLDAIFAGNSMTPSVRGLMNVAGTFSLPPAWQWGNYVVSFDLGDFNGDGLPDLIFSSNAPVFGTTIVLNSATGFLGPASATTLVFTRIRAVDVNGDGVDEVLGQGWASNPWYGLSLHAVTSNPPVIGPAIQSWPTGSLLLAGPGHESVRDLDGDGDRDVLGKEGYPYQPLLLMNGGAGSFVRLGGHATGVAPISRTLTGDLDLDGDVDVVGFTQLNGTNVIATGLNDGDGYCTPGPSTPFNLAGGLFYYTLFQFDRDGDGDLDLYAAWNMAFAFGGAPADTVYDCNGGAFTQVATVPSTGGASAFRAFDFDNDGDQDILVGRRPPGTVTAPVGPMQYVGNLGPLGLAAPIPIGISHQGTFDLDLGDFDGNGTMDVFQTNTNIYGPTLDPCVVYLNSGTAAFTPVVQAFSGYYTAAGDLNNDGLADLVVDGQVWFAAGGGTFAPGPALASAIVGPPTLSDVDQDGDLDLVETPGTVMYNAGGGVFGPPQSTLYRGWIAPTSWEVPYSSVADVDRDGDLDILAPGPRILLNTTRQLARASIPRPGRPGSVDLYGTPGGAWFLFGSTGTTSFPFAPWGNVLIDPASAQLGAMGLFAAAGPTAGTASFGVTLPNNPALVGSTTYWQAIDAVQMRFTNRLTVTVMGY